MSTAMEISGGQGVNGPHLFGLAPNFLEIGATVAPFFGHNKHTKAGFPENMPKFSLAPPALEHTTSTEVVGKGVEKLQNS